MYSHKGRKKDCTQLSCLSEKPEPETARPREVLNTLEDKSCHIESRSVSLDLFPLSKLGFMIMNMNHVVHPIG